MLVIGWSFPWKVEKTGVWVESGKSAGAGLREGHDDPVPLGVAIGDRARQALTADLGAG
jgi:hypothetical protein